MINITVSFLKELKPYRLQRNVAGEERTARVEMNRWGDNGRLADGAKQQTKKEQLAGKAASGSSRQWFWLAGNCWRLVL